MSASSRKAILILAAVFLLRPPAWALDPAPPKTEVQTLRQEVTRLEARVRYLEALLRAKGAFPPPKAENPAAWADVEIRFDKVGNASIDGAAVSTDDIKRRMAAIFQSGKFPSVRLVASSRLSFARIETALRLLGDLGVPDVSFAAAD